MKKSTVMPWAIFGVLLMSCSEEEIANVETSSRNAIGFNVLSNAAETYLWAAEHYLDANFFGRYLAHGSMQILTGKPDEMVTFTTSGWQEAGFDWNRFPGTTTIHLPFDQLRAKVMNVDTFSARWLFLKRFRKYRKAS